MGLRGEAKDVVELLWREEEDDEGESTVEEEGGRGGRREDEEGLRTEASSGHALHAGRGELNSCCCKRGEGDAAEGEITPAAADEEEEEEEEEEDDIRAVCEARETKGKEVARVFETVCASQVCRTARSARMAA